MIDWQPRFEAALPCDEWIDRYGHPGRDRPRWQNMCDRVVLSAAQRDLLASFTRRMNVLCLAGVWCGDCIEQGAILHRIAEASDRIDLRFLDRDEHEDVQAELSICGGQRVPMVVFLSEDFYECSRMGDRPLTKYRSLAATLGGPSCPIGVGTPEFLQAEAQDWINEFERVQLMLRLSPRLRWKHRD